MDAINLLISDHREVETYFRQFEEAGPRANVTKAKLVSSMIRALSVHAAIEEGLFYPAARRASTDSNEQVLESLEEHHIVKWVCSELEGMEPTDERFEAKVTVLMENVRHHVEEEEQDLFPKIKDALSEEHLAELGRELEEAKAVAPTRPHPKAPDTPPANLVANLVSGGLDRVRDVVKAVTPKL
jgi:hemerythrin superfamily protein